MRLAIGEARDNPGRLKLEIFEKDGQARISRNDLRRPCDGA